MYKQYQEQIGLQEDLINFYRKNTSTISLTPLMEENDVPLDEFYVPPPIQSVELQGHYLIRNPVKTPVTNYHQLLFSKKTCAYEHIYVTAKAGIGKTSFCKHICMAWCQAHRPDTSVNRFRTDDINALKFFDFMFMISLRDVDQSLCELEKIVHSFAMKFLTNNERYIRHISKILRTKSCIVILDGLDEWTHSRSCKLRKKNHVPYVVALKKCTIMTTTRPWKFDEIRLQSSKYDRHIELCELDDKSSNQLVLKEMGKLTINSIQEKFVKEFYQEIDRLKIGSIYHIPYINLQMVCLKSDGKEVGKTKCEIYTNIIELSLERGIQKHNEGPQTARKNLAKSIPQYVAVKTTCNKYYSLLLHLGKLAFNSLFGLERQSSLVFDRTVALKYLASESELKFCLHCGLLSQSKCYSFASVRQSDVTFQHKTIQEYFSALYIQSEWENEQVKDTILKVCSSLNSILQMSEVFIFLSGLNPYVCSSLFDKLLTLASGDDTALSYRKNLEVNIYKGTNLKKIFGLQNLLVSCMRESMETNTNGDLILRLEHIFVEEQIRDHEYRSIIKRILSNNSNDNVKALSVSGMDSADVVSENIKYLNLDCVNALEKMVLWSCFQQQDIVKILSHNTETLKCISIGTSYTRKTHTFAAENKNPLSRELHEAIINMPYVQTISLAFLEMSHKQLEEIVQFFNMKAEYMNHVGIARITCVDHRKSCEGVLLDLSRQTQLRKMYVDDVPLTQIIIKTDFLEEIEIGTLQADVFASLLSQLPPSLESLNFKTVREDYYPILSQAITKLSNLKLIDMFQMNLGDITMNLPYSMHNFEEIVLEEVTITSAALEGLIMSVSKLKKSAYVRLENSNVTPNVGFEKLKKKIKENIKVFHVISDGTNEFGKSDFQFRTVKH